MKERRRERLASFLEDELPVFFRSIESLEEGTLISVIFVEIVESGSRANIFVTVYPDNLKEGVVKMLKMSENEATSFIRKRLGTKYSPLIRFHVR